ncbi:tripartite motif-containing protein 2-like [Ptychodera flava]|uniref:tripartite motif-containing protein 2-like n=1 Tax=Ptychodera flava TaxID=63121 RepID=UPI003969C891
MKSPNGSTEKVGVFDDRNECLTLKTNAKVEGKHELSVSVRNKPVKGSPVRIQVIPKKGLLCKFGEKGSGVGQLNRPYGVKIVRNDTALVCDHNNNRIQSFNFNRNYDNMVQFMRLDELQPNDVTVFDDGNIVITDEGRREICVCDENGKVIRFFGKGNISLPVGIEVNPINSKLYVVDYGAHCVHIYDQDGNHIKSFGRYGSKEGEFNRPWFICVDGDGNVYVADGDNHRIQVFDIDGQFMYSFGSQGSGDGQFDYPRGVAVDKHGYVYVSDSDNNRVVKYEAEGKFVCRVDCEGNGLRSPYGICVTDDEPFGRVLVVDHGNNCVKVLAQ